MPRKDGTGPMSNGRKTGKGFGTCLGVNNVSYSNCRGMGLNCRRGFGNGSRRHFAEVTSNENSRKQQLLETKSILENQIKVINNQLEFL